jgi:hypothetical protein
VNRDWRKIRRGRGLLEECSLNGEMDAEMHVGHPSASGLLDSLSTAGSLGTAVLHARPNRILCYCGRWDIMCGARLRMRPPRYQLGEAYEARNFS